VRIEQCTKENCLDDLVAFRATVTDKRDAKKLDEAIEHIQRSLDDELWVDDTHLQRKHGDRVFHEEHDAVKKLQHLLKDKKSDIPDATLLAFIQCFTSVDRQLAVIAVDEAEAAGVQPKKIAQDRKEIEKGDEEAARGKYDKAIEHYRHAWKHAVHIKIKPPQRLASGAVHIEFEGIEGETYVIQASSDLVHWTTLGSVTADDQGTVIFDDTAAGEARTRFYRIVEPAPDP
jgi:hypothetical protein